ncbi:MAG: flagellar biosynthesis repressor FlbT [Mangrovicoccus sp.]|nr:flagellar biosynthesis repressor FlbT [Mangrovicoccus sp.]
MTGLVLKLSPRERILINGAVIENGDRRSRLNIITPNAHILRLKDAIHPDDANTPVRRVCYITQLVLSGDISPDEGTPQIAQGLQQLSDVFRDAEHLRRMQSAAQFLAAGQFYQVLKSLRTLLPMESELLERDPK